MVILFAVFVPLTFLLITEAKKLFETVNDPHEWDVAVSYLKKRYGADAVDEAIKIEHLEM